MKNNYIELGKIIKRERIRKEISRRNLSRLINISDTELKRIEEGERKNPNLITLISICKILKIDLLNLLEDAEYYEREEEKLYYVIVKYKNTDVFKIHAESDIKALMIIIDLLSENDLIEKSENGKNISFFTTSDEQLYQKVLIDFNEKSEEEIAEKYNKKNNEINEFYKGYQEVDEDYEDEYDDMEEENSCRKCKYYCNVCNECTFDE